MRALDLTGKVFNHLTVEQYVGRKNNARIWRSRCVCGNTRDNTVSELNSGVVKSCGCMPAATRYDHLEDLTGRTFGKWTVTSKAKHGFMCVCVCGTVRNVQRNDLEKGISKSCSVACSRYVEIEVGQTSGFWTYLGDAGYTSKKRRLLSCKCTCGTVKNVLADSFITGASLSCGCYKAMGNREKMNRLNLVRKGKPAYNRSDSAGIKYNHLTAIEAIESRKGRVFWKFSCDCGGELIAHIGDVKSGLIKGCAACRKQRFQETRKSRLTSE